MDAQKQARREMLETLEREPYFARLDFQEDGMEQPVSYYIGKRGLDKHDTNELPSMQSCFLLFQVSALRGDSSYQRSGGSFLSRLNVKNVYK